MQTQKEIRENLKSAVIAVGDGRGFVVQGARQKRYVITAAHCLPKLPPCQSASYVVERTYANLLAPLGAKPAVWAECLFADPIADIAVLGAPDGEAFYEEKKEESEQYEALTESASTLSISDAPEADGPVWLFSLTEELIACRVKSACIVDL